MPINKIMWYTRVGVFNSINYNSVLIQKTRPSFCFFGSVKFIIARICHVVISFILFMINQVIKYGLKISFLDSKHYFCIILHFCIIISALSLFHYFIICIQISYFQKCVKDLIFLLLVCRGYIESNPGPKTSDFSKVTVLKVIATSTSMIIRNVMFFRNISQGTTQGTEKKEGKYILQRLFTN